MSKKPSQVSPSDDPGSADKRADRLETDQVGGDARVAEVNDPDRVREQIREYRREQGKVEDASRPVPDSHDSSRRDDEPFDLVLRGQRVLSDGAVGPREVGVVDGRITAIEPLGAGLQGKNVVELHEDETLIPGLVDAHVHVNEPGRTEWEGFATATRAAAAGGVTAMLDMPLNSIPSTVNGPALEYKRLIAEPQVFIDVGFWAGAVPGNLSELHELHDEGVFGFKCFLLDSGVDEFPPLGPDEFEQYLKELTSFGAMMIVHAENSGAIDGAPQCEGSRYDGFLQSRPRGAENLAISEVIERTRWTGGRSHILHLSSSDALPMISSAKRDGLDLSVETCPHYLTLVAEDIPDGATAFKCCPPIREAGNREALWQGLLDGTIDYIASDHSPSTVELKSPEGGDFGTAWGGVASVQLGLPLIWTEAQRRGISLEQVVDWMSARPAARVNMARKGNLALGYDADLVVFAAEETFVVHAQDLHHKNPITAYEGKTLTGVVKRTFVRGTEVDFGSPHGRLMSRGQD